ncbi:SNF2 family N-terminal domain-containing protein [Amylostereum chailletii]|nr:SNF2 family N-terminal domain-containing protein [Amylostereum chailletii]
MIYAARSDLASSTTADALPSTPSPKKLVTRPESPPSPNSPDVAVRRGKRTRKLVASDDEEETSRAGSDGEPSRFKRRSVERRVLDYFNDAGPEGLQEITGCKPDQASAIIGLRPFSSVNDLMVKLGQGKKKAGPNGISPRMFDDMVEIFEGYGSVDDVLLKCEKIGAKLRGLVAQWTGSRKGKERESSSKPSRSSSVASGDDVWEDGALTLRSIAPISVHQSKDFLAEQPRTLSNDVQLKEYQLLGLNWLRLMYTQGYSCILADEMGAASGLGKTIQVISLFAHLKESGRRGPHLIVVPSSTLENWVREFDKFAPSISVQTYYGGKDERPYLRQSLLEALKSKKDGWEVLITTYNLASGDDRDRRFLKKIDWDTCVFDEGHILKNYQSQRYQTLIKNPARWKLLLTGTPLQNNLQELVSLMNFILPQILAPSMDALRAVFKAKGDSRVTLLARDRVIRAKKMMTPFVLRRRKDQVLKDLPKKIERIEWCDMTPLQRKLYNDTLHRSRKTVFDKSKPVTRAKDKLYLENSSNVLMDLRKAASHPMLFRTRFTNKQLDSITKVLMKEPDVSKRYKQAAHLKEDLEMSSDMELQMRVQEYRSTSQFLQDAECYLQAGKVQILLKLIEQYRKAGRRMLVFSQFVLVLEILVAAFKHKGIKFLMLTGQTPVDQRQAMVDDFTENETIPVFLLSTKAGGVGINLTAASVVIIFDQDFNPHNDKQAQDRAYRIGQKRDVDVVKLITRGSIEEDMLKLGQTKLALDQAVAGDEEAGENVERQMKTSLMSMLRKQATEEKPEERIETLEDLEPLTDLED